MSLKDQISAYGSKFKVVPVAIDGIKELYIREMAAGDRESVEDLLEAKAMGNKLRATIFVKSVCDKDGNLLYTDDDILEVNAYKLTLLSKVFDESNKINGIMLGETNAVDNELKNS